MQDDWNPPNAPNLKQDFNEAAEQQAKKEVPVPSEKGISTKSEVDKRTEISRVLREKLERQNAPVLRPNNEIAQGVAEEQRAKDQRAYEENETTKEQIARRLKQKKDQEMHREFNKSAEPSMD